MSSRFPIRAGLCACLLITASCLEAGPDPRPLPDLGQPPAALSTWVGATLRENPQVQAAQAALSASTSQREAADRPLYNPSLDFAGEQAATTTTALGVSQTIDWADKRAARTEVASHQLKATEAELAQVYQELAAALLTALANYRTRVELTTLATERLDLIRRSLALAERRRAAGDLNQIEFESVRLTVVEAELERAQVSVQGALAEQELVRLVGEAPREWPSIPTDLPPLKPVEEDLDAWVRSLPRIRAREAQVAAVRAQVELRRRERRPDPTLGVRGGSEDSEALIGLNLSIPLYVRNSFRAEVEAQTFELIRAEREAQSAFREARTRLRSAAARYRLTREAWQTWQRVGAASLRARIDLLQRTWQAGELSTTEYLVQFNQTLDTQASALELRGELWRAWFEWLEANARVADWLNLKPVTAAP